KRMPRGSILFMIASIFEELAQNGAWRSVPDLLRGARRALCATNPSTEEMLGDLQGDTLADHESLCFGEPPQVLAVPCGQSFGHAFAGSTISQHHPGQFCRGSECDGLRRSGPPRPSAGALGYMATGVDDDVTLKANREGFKKYQLRAR